MKKRIFIKASDDGKTDIIYLHSDRVASIVDGPKVAPRVSNIVYDPVMDRWNAMLLDGTSIGSSKDREEAIKIEIEVIDKMFAERKYIPGGFHQPPRLPVPDGFQMRPE